MAMAGVVACGARPGFKTVVQDVADDALELAAGAAQGGQQP